MQQKLQVDGQAERALPMGWLRSRCIGLGCLAAIGFWASSNPVMAQLVPDQTLGGESSIVTPNQLNDGTPIDQINGGAIRGVNLFHSFRDFNIQAGQGAYFANPTGIENILTRVTGNNPSDILGTLGVLGNANLFLINPNGIFFGPNARLDVAGSFTASTASAFKFPDGSEFSATNPQAPPLLTINITPGLQYGNPSSANSSFPGQEKGATIVNRGILTTGQDLTLAAHNLDLQGELWAGRDLTLTALETVKIRDQVDAPFVAVAGRDLRVQGNQSVDIFALNHRDSGFYSGRDMTFRSANPVGGDAHYWAGSNFQIETLDGTLGKLYSPYDPIIVTPGSVRIFAYTGASLHIIAGGSVEILGPIEITGADNSGPNNTISLANPLFAGLANGTLPDGTPFTIDGSARPTLDIRSGITCPSPACDPPVLRGGNFTNLVAFTNAGLADDATITSTINVGNIQISAPDGQVFLSNNHLNPTFPNNPSTLAGDGSITVGQIFTNDVTGGFTGDAGEITINARGVLTIPKTLNATSSSGNGGDVRLVANGNIKVQADVLTGSTFANGQGGSINVTSLNGAVETSMIDLDSSSVLGNAGEVNLRADGDITTGNVLAVSSEGQGGNVTLKVTGTTGGIDTTAGELDSSSVLGSAGNITLEAPGLITTGNIFARSNTGDGGAIRLESITGGITTTNGELDSRSTNRNSGVITLQAQREIVTANLFSASTNGQGGDITVTSNGNLINASGGTLAASSSAGAGGNITLNALGDVTTGTLQAASISAPAGGINITSQTGNINLSSAEIRTDSKDGNGGDINLTAFNDLNLFNDLTLEASGQLSGNINLTSNNGNIALSQSLVRSSSSTAIPSGVSGSINLIASQGDIQLTQSRVLVETTGAADSGDLLVTAQDQVDVTGRLGQSGGFLALTRGSGKTGNVTLSAKDLQVANLAQISAITAGEGDSRNVTLNVNNEITLDGGFLFASTNSQADTGDAGILTVNTNRLTLKNRGVISAASQSSGQGGELVINARDSVSVENPESQINLRAFSVGDARTLTLTTGKLTIRDQGEISATSQGGGKAGSVTINASESVILETEGRLLSDTLLDGNAGNIAINTPGLFVRSSGEISARTGDNSTGQAGTLIVRGFNSDYADVVEISGAMSGTSRSRLAFDSFGTGQAGELDIQANEVRVFDGGQISGTTRKSGEGGRILVNAPTNITISGSDNGIVSSLEFDSRSSGDARGITLNTSQLTVDGGLLTVSGDSTGSPGNIDINATTGNLRNQASLTAETITSSGGSIRFQGDALTLSESELSTSTQDGQAGRINIATDDSVNLANGSTIASQATGTGNAGEVTLTTNTFSSDNSTTSTSVVDGAGGTIAITADDSVNLANGSTIASQATGTGNAGEVTLTTNTFSSDNSTTSTSVVDGAGGTIDITAPTQVNLNNNSQITSAATGNNGTAGAIQITTADLNLTNSQATVRGEGNSTAGNMQVNADQIDLNQGTIAATTETGSGGNINLTGRNGQPSNTLTATNNSKISAETADGQQGGQVTIAADAVNLDNSQVSAQATGTGNAGGVQITANGFTARNGEVSVSARDGQAGNVVLQSRTVQLSDQARLTAETVNESSSGGNIQLQGLETLSAIDSVISASTENGQGGTVNIQAQQSVLLDQGSQLEAVATGNQGRPGGVSVTSDRLTIQNNSRASVSAVGNQNAGGITFTVPQVRLNNGGQLAATTAAGTGGTIAFPTLQTLTLNNQSSISTSTQDGQGSNLLINATDEITLNDQSRISSEATGQGSGGLVSLAAPKVTLQDDAVLTTQAANGPGGAIQVNASESFKLAQGVRITSAASGSGSAGNINLTTAAEFNPVDDVQITVSNTGTGNAGNLEITAPVVKLDRRTQLQAITNSGQGGTITFSGLTDFSMDNNSLISSETQDGVGGSILINAPDRMSLNNGSKITASATGNGNSGNIDLLTNNPLAIANGSQITVNSQGTGQGGEISIVAAALNMTTNTLIGATTTSGNGGNIKIRVDDSIDLRFNSDIRTDAQGNGNGGNITLLTNFFIRAILAEDSDVIAGSVTGTGGRIESPARSITGFRLFQNVDTPESDFTASSEFGVDGTVVLNIFNLPAEPLPEGLAAPPIANLCQAGSGQRSSFRQIGGGGVLPAPGRALTPNTVQVGLVSPVAEGSAPSALSSQNIERADPNAPPDRIVEAQGWRKLPDGTIVLTASPDSAVGYTQSGFLNSVCGE